MQTGTLDRLSKIISTQIEQEVRIVALPVLGSVQRYRVYITALKADPNQHFLYNEIKFNIDGGSERQIVRDVLRKYERIQNLEDAPVSGQTASLSPIMPSR